MEDIKSLTRRLEELEGKVSQIKGDIDKSPLRIESSSIAGFMQTVIRWAVIIEGPPDNRRWAWANMIDVNGSEITGGPGSKIKVYFEVYGQKATMIDKCVPRLYKGPAGIGDSAVVPITQRPYNTGALEMRWYCFYPLNESKECVCTPATE